VILHDYDGVLVPPRHPKEWAAALGALLDDPARRKGMSERGLVKAQLYDWEHVVDEVLDVYRVARERAGASTEVSSVHVQAPGLG
jgi:glycosyltransferase involved in cell wall biosynthesis